MGAAMDPKVTSGNGEAAGGARMGVAGAAVGLPPSGSVVAVPSGPSGPGGFAAGRRAESSPTGGATGLAGLARTLGPRRSAALGGAALAMLAFFAFVAWRVGAPDYAILFAGLQLADAERLTERLDAMQVPYQLSGGGDAIMVPADRALRLRMSLAEEGMPLGSTVGYELLDRAGPFGASEFQSNVNLQRATEGELARTIGTLRQVRSARVHINVPRREPFARETAPATASIVLALRGGAELDKRQVEGIRQLAAAAVPGLTPARVTLLDDRGTLLGRATEPGTPGFAAGDAEDYRAALEARLKGKIVQLLERTLGPGRVDAEVAADVDFDEATTTAETYDPNGQVVRSTQSTSEKSDSEQQQGQDPVTVANNLPTERAQSATASAPGGTERSGRTEETVNYEISRTVRNQTHRGGSVRRLSVAVQVDGLYRPQPDGTRAYEPRPAEELKEIAQLVRGAAGISDERGDRLEVVTRQFVQAPGTAAGDGEATGPDREDYWRIVELGTFAALTLAVLLLGVRPLVRRALAAGTSGEGAVTGTPAMALLDAAGRPIPGTTDAGGADPALLHGPAATEAGALAIAAPAGGQPSMLPLRSLRGRVHDSLLEDVVRVVEEHPEDAVRVIRGWMHGRPNDVR